MKLEVKQKWINALRSGKYKQTTQRLCSANGYCCLGVLTELYLLEHKLEWKDYLEDRYISGVKYPNVPSIQSCISYDIQFLAEEVVKWAELDSSRPSVNRISLSSLNDSGCDFNHIADRIEKEL